CGEHPAEARWILDQEVRNGREKLFGFLSKIGAIQKSRETQQHVRRDGVARWRRIIEEVLGACDERLMVAGGEEKPAMFRVPKVGNHVLGERLGARQPFGVECELV